MDELKIVLYTVKDPDFVDDEGVKWWFEPTLTNYAINKGFNDGKVWVVERPDGYRTRLFTEGSDLLAEDQTIEGICFKIDLLAKAKKHQNDPSSD